MDTRLSVEIDSELKKEIQMRALQNDTSLKEIIAHAIKFYLKSPEELQKYLDGIKDNEIEIN